MAFDEGLTAYSSKGFVQPYTSVMSVIYQLFDEAGEHSGPAMDAAIQANFSPDLAAKLIGKDSHDRVDDEPTTWDESGEPWELDIGFFLYAREIDFDKGTMIVDHISGGGEMSELFFPSQQFLGSEFRDADFEANISGLSFEFGKIELLLPNFELGTTRGFNIDKAERNRRVGRPIKWDWDGALAFIVSQAQRPDGLPTGHGAQARVEEMISGWFLDEMGEAPATSQVRQRAAKIIRMLERP